ncbi:superoxide dismutase [Ni], partial [Thermodesulfobacteriota bacterium]
SPVFELVFSNIERGRRSGQSTIDKSMKQIVEIEKEKHHNSNQLVRWIMNKENHANAIQEIVTKYFMTQRIKLNTINYEKKVGFLHQMLIYSMKCKQSVDLNNVVKLKNIVNSFQKLYFEEK